MKGKGIPFEDRIIVRGMHWTAYLEPDQYTLGSSYIWLNRNNGSGPIVREMTEIELFSDEFNAYCVMEHKLRKALKSAFSPPPDRINVCELGNRTPELHPKLFPRYKEPVKFEGISFYDVSYPNGSAQDNNKTSIPPEIFYRMRDRIAGFVD